MNNDPTTWDSATWILAGGAACLGGAVNWWARTRASNPRAFSFFELVGEIATSGLVGMSGFMALASVGQPLGLCAAVAGVSGHMSARLLFVVERAFERQLRAMTDDKESAQ